MTWAQLTGFSYFNSRADPRYEVVVTADAFGSLIRRLEGAQVIAFDTETSGLAWWRHARICGVSFTTKEGDRYQSAYVPVRHLTAESQLSEAVVMPAIGRILADPSKLIIGHNLKFDDHMARREGWSIAGQRDDTMVRARLFDENQEASLKHRALVDLGDREAHLHEELLGREIVRLARLNGQAKRAYLDRYGYAQIPIDLCGLYAGRDTEYTYRLHERYADIPARFPRIYPTEMRLTRVLCDIEEAGVPIDVEYLTRLRGELEHERHEIERRVWEAFGGHNRFELSEDDQLRFFLQKKLKLELWKKTRGGKLSVDREVLEFLCEDVPALRLILDWREATKLSSTYTDSILAKLDDRGLLHGDFQQLGTETGRLSCRAPNLQNLPSDDDDRALAHSGKKLKDGGVDPWSIHRAFVNRGKGWARLYFDYSQIELRVLAFYTRDPVLLEAYLTGEDIHTRTSREVFGTDDPAKRRMAKVINFGLSYCLSSQGFARQARISESEAEAHYARFHQRYAGIPAFRSRFWSYVRSHGGTFQNLFGRERHVPLINSHVGKDRGRGERQSIGALIQGQAAEFTKESLCRIADWFEAERIPAMICQTIHDEIQIDTPIECFGRVAQGTKWIMENYPEFEPVPIRTGVAYSTESWASKMPVPGLN